MTTPEQKRQNNSYHSMLYGSTRLAVVSSWSNRNWFDKEWKSMSLTECASLDTWKLRGSTWSDKDEKEQAHYKHQQQHICIVTICVKPSLEILQLLELAWVTVRGSPLMNILTWNMTSLMPKSHLSRVEECQGTHGQSLWDIALVRVAKQVWNSRLSNLYNYSVHHHMILFGSLGVFHGYPLPMSEKLTNHYH